MKSPVVAFVVYTLLRLALFAVIWLLIDWLTPLGPLWSAVAAILISGALSLVFLDRQRGAMAQSVGGFFGRLNSRIERSATAEDEADDAARAAAAGQSNDASGDREQHSGEQTDGQQQGPGLLQSGDEGGPDRS